MTTQKYLYSLLVLSLGLATGCASKDSQTTKAYQDSRESKDISNTVAANAGAHNFVNIEFEKGSAILTDKARVSLNQIINQARSSGSIDQVMVMSWSDQEYRSASAGRLSREHAELA